MNTSVANTYLPGKGPYSRFRTEVKLKLLGKDPLVDVHLWDPVAVHCSEFMDKRTPARLMRRRTRVASSSWLGRAGFVFKLTQCSGLP